MPAPTFVTSVDTSSWAHAFGGSLSMGVTTQIGDLIVVVGSMKNNMDGMAISSSPAITWTQRVDFAVDLAHSEIFVWTGTATAAGSMTINVSRGATTEGDDGIVFGATAYQWRDHGGYGGLATGSGTATAPSVNITTTAANSAIVVLNGDRAATALTSQTYRTAAGTFTQRTAVVAQNNDTLGNEYVIYHGYHADAGSIGTYAVGMTAPASQTWALAAIEVLGTGGGGGGSGAAMPNRQPLAGLF